MIEAIKDIQKWNKIAGNTDYNRHREASMLSEELAEAIIGLKENDIVEVADGILDIFVVGIGTLTKMGLTAEQIDACFKEIMRSNYSKFIEEDGELTALKHDGKVIKPESFSRPDLVSILKDC